MAELLWRGTLIALLPNNCVRRTETVIFPRGDESWAVIVLFFFNEISNEVLRKLFLSNVAVIEK